jgi:hypothetical protein
MSELLRQLARELQACPREENPMLLAIGVDWMKVKLELAERIVNTMLASAEILEKLSTEILKSHAQRR